MPRQSCSFDTQSESVAVRVEDTDVVFIALQRCTFGASMPALDATFRVFLTQIAMYEPFWTAPG